MYATNARSAMPIAAPDEGGLAVRRVPATMDLADGAALEADGARPMRAVGWTEAVAPADAGRFTQRGENVAPGHAHAHAADIERLTPVRNAFLLDVDPRTPGRVVDEVDKIVPPLADRCAQFSPHVLERIARPDARVRAIGVAVGVRGVFAQDHAHHAFTDGIR